MAHFPVGKFPLCLQLMHICKPLYNPPPCSSSRSCCMWLINIISVSLRGPSIAFSADGNSDLRRYLGPRGHWVPGAERRRQHQDRDQILCFVKQVAPWVALTSYSCHLVYMKTDGKVRKKSLWVFPVFIQTAVILTESCLHLKTHYV